MKKNKIFFNVLLCALFPLSVFSQIKNTVVEKYYISDSNDATDTIGGGIEIGTTTYRIYVELDPETQIRKIYGDANHAMQISSTLPFFNQIDRGKTFGYEISNLKLKENTLALDTWITLGMATNKHLGSLKDLDTNASIIGGLKNDGGSAEIAGGLLRNTASDIGLPLTSTDGLILSNSTYSFNNYGFVDLVTQNDSTIFGSLNKKNTFKSNEAFIMCQSGMPGIDNKVLLAQLTTKGEISFEINLELVLPNGEIKKYVANNGIIQTDETLSPFLKYPFDCGCLDADYLEYSNHYACNDAAACKTPIVLGCMDPFACNFDSNANSNVSEMCCYPGKCNDRDISIVCPSLTKVSDYETKFYIYPNPVQKVMTLELQNDAIKKFNYSIINNLGFTIQQNLSVETHKSYNDIDVSKLTTGYYIIKIETELGIQNITFYKK